MIDYQSKIDYLTVDYVQLVMINVLYNTGLGRSYIKFQLCPFANYSCVMDKKGYSYHISFLTNFALIYWACLIGFGGKSHRSCNLAHTIGDLD